MSAPAPSELIASLSWRDVRQEMARRLAQESFIWFVRAVAPWFRIEEVHLLIADALERLVSGEFDRLMIFMPPRAGKPVDEEAMVLCGDGIRRPLKSIRVGDSVITDQGRPRRVQAVHVQGDLPVVEIRTRHGRTVRAALDHPFLTTRGWVEAGDLRHDDVLAVPNGADDIALSNDLEACRLAGYFVGDGSTTWQTRPSEGRAGNCNAAITCFDPVEAHDIRHCIAALGFEEGRQTNPNRILVKGGVRKWLIEHDLAGKKSTEKRVPDFVFRSSNDEIANFIGAYFSCDGSVFKKTGNRSGSTVEFASTNRLLLSDVQHLLWRLGINSILKPKNGRDQLGRDYASWRLTLYSADEVTKFTNRVPVFGIKADRLAEWRKPKATFDPPYLCDPIASVEPAGIRPCRCLTVEEDHTFLAEDLVVHNSQLISKFFPAWYLGKHPTQQVMQVSYKAELATGFGREVRDLLLDPDYQAIFPDVTLRKDVRAASAWMVDHGLEGEPQGVYYAAGVTGGIAGKGWHLGIIDDPLSEQDAVSEKARAYVRDWYGPGFYTRRQPEDAKICLMTTRWALDDLPGHLLDVADDPDNEYADQWHVISIPAILDANAAKLLNLYNREARDLLQDIEDTRARKEGREPEVIKPVHFEAGDSYQPRRWPKASLQRQMGQMSNRNWLALYQQQPLGDQGNILLREWWKPWPKKTPPKCEMIICCYDTAFEEDEGADYSARTTWGVFKLGGMSAIILLERWKKQVGFPELREEAKAHYKDYEPDLILIEKRASGTSLLQELRRLRYPARAWLPPTQYVGRYKAKVPRAHAASVVLEQGQVYYMDRAWAREVIDECAAFPFAEHDDLTDTVTMALLFLRKMMAVDFRDEIDDDDEPEPQPVRKRLYA